MVAVVNRPGAVVRRQGYAAGLAGPGWMSGRPRSVQEAFQRFVGRGEELVFDRFVEADEDGFGGVFGVVLEEADGALKPGQSDGATIADHVG